MVADLMDEKMGEAMSAGALQALAGALLTTDIRRLPERLEFEVRVEGVGPEEVQRFFTPAPERLP